MSQKFFLALLFWQNNKLLYDGWIDTLELKNKIDEKLLNAPSVSGQL